MHDELKFTYSISIYLKNDLVLHLTSPAFSVAPPRRVLTRFHAANDSRYLISRCHRRLQPFLAARV